MSKKEKYFDIDSMLPKILETYAKVDDIKKPVPAVEITADIIAGVSFILGDDKISARAKEYIELTSKKSDDHFSNIAGTIKDVLPSLAGLFGGEKSTDSCTKYEPNAVEEAKEFTARVSKNALKG